ISGIGISPGYLNNEDLTQEKFIAHPFKAGERLYKTGDLAKWLPDGNIEFLGRIDHQVKIRGFRIELGEIENVLLQYKSIQECVVLAREDQGDKYLCAYVVSDKEQNNEDLRTYLSGLLPDYMLPSYFVALDKIPLTSIGKVDRKSLPAPEIKAGSGYLAPQTLIETKLVKIWSEVLNVASKEISTNASFFELGGHSLKATVLVSRIHKELDVRIELREVFQSQTIQAQANLINSTESSSYFSIPKAKNQEYYPLSSSQRRLYLLQQMDLGSIAYNMPGLIAVPKGQNKHQITEVFNKLIARHENFRTSFDVENEFPVQRIHSEVAFSVKDYQITNSELPNVKEDFVQAFDLSKAPLLRVAYLEIIDGDDMLLIDMHHIISDGKSHSILEEDFSQLILGKELEPLRLHYKDYSQWQNSSEQQERIKGQESYWLDKFTDDLPVLELPMDYSRPVMQSFEGARVSFVLSAEETKIIHDLSKDQGLTLYMSLLSIFTILLSKLSGQEDIIVGSPIAARRHSDLEDIVGMFVNTLAIRSDVSGDKRLIDYLQELKENTLEAYENQEYQFEDLVEQVVKDRDISRNPLFDVMFNFLKGEFQEIKDSSTKELIHTQGISKFDLSLSALDLSSSIQLSFEYSTKLFESETIERFINYFRVLLQSLSSNYQQKIKDLNILSEEEKQQVLYEFNNTESDYPKDKTILQLFEDQVKQTPGNIALVSQNESLTYSELNKKSNELAHYLIKKGASEQNFIAVVNDSSVKTYVGILGILRIGKAYLPIDSTLPDSRIQFMLEDCGIKTILSNNDQNSFINNSNKQFDIVNVEEIKISNSSDLNLSIHSVSPVYVIYTSGSTGKPKGVVVEHKSLVNLCLGHNKFYGIEATDRSSKYAGFGFDASVWEFFPIIIVGASLYIVDEDIKLDPEKVNNYFEENKITISFLPTQFCEKFMEYDNKSLRILLTGGDKLNSYTKRDYKLFNNYGPTENTVVTTRFEVKKQENNISIGKPIENNQVYILGKNNQVQPIGVLGELCIGGIGLSQGYLNNENLTKEKFIDHPFKEGERIYKTGDLARWLTDGNIEFLGRIDHQVKIRGFRIELGEIEYALHKHDNIKDSVVIDIEENGEKYLCAYLVTEEDFNEEEIRTYLSASLPDYMIPSYFVELEKVPLNSNGKVNRKALPSPEIKAGDDYVAPSNEIEEKLVKIWSEVLKVPQEEISTTVSFFAIGGHSLKATLLISRIHKELSVKLPLKEVFQQQTINKMALCISKVSKLSYSSIKLAEKKEYHTLSSAQKRLYFIQQMDFQSLSYNMPMAIPLGSDIEVDNIENTFVNLVSRHESFRTSFITINNEPVQRVYDNVDFKLDIKKTTREDLDRDIKEYIRPFDLSKDILIRACLMNVSNKQYVLVVDMHHIISDGTTSNIVREDFLKLFNGEKIAPLKLQYKDFSNWQNTLIEKGELKSQERYWKNLFSGDIPVLNLPTDYKRPESFTYKGDVCRFSLDEDETSSFRDLGKGMGSTLYMNVLAVLNTLFYRFSNQEDIIIGSGIAGRQHSDLQGISGMFINTLAIRNYPNGNKTFIDFLKEVSDNSIAAFENQDVQFEDLVDMLNIDRDISRNPLFDINMVVQNFEDILDNQREADVITEEDSTPTSNFYRGTSKFDMIFFVSETVNTINISIEYYSDIFKRETIEKFIRCFKSIVSSIIKNPKVKLKEIELLSQEEKQQLLHEFNDTQFDYPKDKTIHELFEEQVDKAPNNIALVCGQEQTTYKELDNKSNQIAHYLRFECEVSINECIGIYMDKGANALISMLGILKSGCGYLPLSVSYPEERIKFMINDTSTRIIFSEKRYLKEMNKYQWECSSLRTYMCVDSSNIYEEQETQSSLNNRKLWEYVGDESVDEVTGGGWSSSYTGQAIPQEEMDEYGDNVLKK
ncbi:MAG: amino acid adenylation domain-containing protein, partial [Bacteroidales bacterium]|nr:amino acid adenylation domain-containing protein [Bacteroidales bacterium]